MKNNIKSIPFVGAGLGFREEIACEILQNLDDFAGLEIITERYIRSPSRLRNLKKLTNETTLIPHGVSLSIGSAHINEEHLYELKVICDYLNPPYYSDHMCLTRGPGIDLGHLTPMPYTHDTLKIVIDNVNVIQEYLGMPLVLENITYPFDFEHNTLTQEMFFSTVVQETHCGVLLDVENLYINSCNHNFHPETFLNAMPLENVVQLHLAGGIYMKDKCVDTHNQLVHEPVWELLNVVLNYTRNIKSIIIEHDANFPDNFYDLKQQVIRADKMMKKHNIGPSIKNSKCNH